MAFDIVRETSSYPASVLRWCIISTLIVSFSSVLGLNILALLFCFLHQEFIEYIFHGRLGLFSFGLEFLWKYWLGSTLMLFARPNKGLLCPSELHHVLFLPLIQIFLTLVGSFQGPCWLLWHCCPFLQSHFELDCHFCHIHFFHQLVVKTCWFLCKVLLSEWLLYPWLAFHFVWLHCCNLTDNNVDLA